MHAESLVKRWSGLKSNAVTQGFERSSFWSLYNVSLCRGLCSSRAFAQEIGGVVNATGELVEEAADVEEVIVSGDRLDFIEAVSPEAEGNGEAESSVDRGMDAIASDMDAAGDAQQCYWIKIFFMKQ